MNKQELAKEMNVTERDIDSLVEMVAESILADGMSNQIVEMSESERVEFFNAYMQAEVKKFTEFCVTLLTNTEKKNALDLYLFSQLKA